MATHKSAIKEHRQSQAGRLRNRYHRSRLRTALKNHRQAIEAGERPWGVSLQLYALRSGLKKPGDSKILPEVISKEPLGPYVREGDDNWFDIVKWSLLVMINAEEMGVTSLNVDHVRQTAKNPEIRRLLDMDEVTGKGLGLEKGWSYRIIKLVGNYGESFDRNLGIHSSLKIKRGLNALWKDGGILYAPPVR